MIVKNRTIKCDYCGKFISYKDLQEDKAYHRILTPDSDISNEEFESCCKDCNHKKVVWVKYTCCICDDNPYSPACDYCLGLRGHSEYGKEYTVVNE